MKVIPEVSKMYSGRFVYRIIFWIFLSKKPSYFLCHYSALCFWYLLAAFNFKQNFLLCLQLCI